MKSAIDKVFRTAATCVCVIGFAVLVLAAGASDAGADLGNVVRMMGAGFAAFVGGCALHRWGLYDRREA